MGSRSSVQSNEAMPATSDMILLDRAISTAKVILDGGETKSVRDPQMRLALVESLDDIPQSGSIHTEAMGNVTDLSPMAKWESEATKDQPWNAIEAFAPAYDIEVRESPLQREYLPLSTRGQNGSAFSPWSWKDENNNKDLINMRRPQSFRFIRSLDG